jgi:hypothetical protein
MLEQEEEHPNIVVLLKKFDETLPRLFSDVITEQIESD